MKTMEQFFGEITTNNELFEQLKKVTSKQELTEFLKANGVEGTVEDFYKVAAKAKQSGELSDEELEAVSGGKSFWQSLQDFFSNIDPLYMLMGI